jgi:hypothetical protein
MYPVAVSYQKGGMYMQAISIKYKNKTIPVFNHSRNEAQMDLLSSKLEELEFNFDFRKKLKMISMIEIIGDVAICKYNDGTKLYLEVS